jgi:predicted phage-related endonuclease
MNINRDSKTILLPATPKRIKKITGTRFAPILGLSPWSTPFEVWCDMTGTFKIPFEDTIYTIAGKVIEPKVIAYLDKKFYFGRGMLKNPEQWFGKTTKQMNFDHFPEEPIFGGMWDARTTNSVWELKTTKRAEDWFKSGSFTPPEYYKLQGALYAKLMGLDEFRMVVTFLEDSDYAAPENFEPNPHNTFVKKYSLAAEYPDFDAKLEACLQWYEKHIAGHISPEWDAGKKNDKEILKALTTAHVPEPAAGEETDIVTELIRQMEPLKHRIDEASASIAADVKAFDKLKDQLKAELLGRMTDNDMKIEAKGSAYQIIVSKTAAGGVDTAKLKADGLYEKYAKNGFTTKIDIKRSDAV